MNFKIIIHALILIFIIHILVINIDYNVNIGNKVENFQSQKLLPNNNENKSMDFLLENKNDNDFINRMKLMSNDVQKIEQNPPKKDVIPSNGFLNNENNPNFDSNVEDVSKFYNIQNNYDNLNESDLKTTPIDSLNKQTENIVTNIDKVDPQGRISEDKPPVWEYNNEFAMNGGSMNGIIGFDGLETQYADFGSNLNFKDNQKSEFNNIPHDDLRKPVVVN